MTEIEHDREKIMRIVWDASPIGVRALARQVGRKVRSLLADLTHLERDGRIVIERPGGGYRAGERVVRLP